jgi:DNA invertase Pin-like site-specific DNA recombinase
MATVQVRYIVTDVNAAIAFYCEKLGFTEVMHPAPGFAMLTRAELAKLLRALEPGDVLIVTRLDRLARSTRDLLNVLDAVAKAKAGFRPLARAELQDIELAVVRQG